MNISVDFENYLPGIIAAISVLALGYFNPPSLQSTDNGVPTGQPNYLYLAGAVMVAYIAVVWIQDSDFYRRM